VVCVLSPPCEGRRCGDGDGGGDGGGAGDGDGRGGADDGSDYGSDYGSDKGLGRDQDEGVVSLGSATALLS
jgi:hypothetical protein